MSLRLTILGCGSSGGVPRVAQGWGACDPANPAQPPPPLLDPGRADGARAARRRVLVDTSPDLREQLLDAGVERLDAILITHPHADHTHGIDDLRPLVHRMRRRVEIHMDAATSARSCAANFAYIFETPPGSSYPPLLNELRLAAGAPCGIDGPGGAIEAIPFDLEHGEIDALGFRVGGLAYTPDLKRVPDASLPFLEDLDVWIIDALRHPPHPSISPWTRRWPGSRRCGPDARS